MTQLDSPRDGAPQDGGSRPGTRRQEGLVDGAMTFQGGPSLRNKRLASRARGFWATVRAALGALLGLAPHVMHHVGILAGAALLAGVWGNSLLYAVGLLLSIPLLNRLRKRFGTWKAPAVGVAVFTAMFLVSALVVGPAISRSGAPGASPASGGPSVAADHASHHGG